MIYWTFTCFWKEGFSANRYTSKFLTPKHIEITHGSDLVRNIIVLVIEFNNNRIY